MMTRVQTPSRPRLRFSEDGTPWIPPGVTEAFMELARVERALAASQALRWLLTLIRMPTDKNRYQKTSVGRN